MVLAKSTSNVWPAGIMPGRVLQSTILHHLLLLHCRQDLLFTLHKHLTAAKPGEVSSAAMSHKLAVLDVLTKAADGIDGNKQVSSSKNKSKLWQHSRWQAASC